MAEQDYWNIEEVLASFDLSFSVDERLMEEFTPMEIILGESLLTPGLQTTVKVHSHFHGLLPDSSGTEETIKNLDLFKGSDINIKITRPILDKFDLLSVMNIKQTVYRLDKRTLFNNSTEEFYIHACDQTMLDDAATLVSKNWPCTSPSKVVSDVLSSCAGAKNILIEPSDPSRDYMAENIHPFQVVAQQANVALAKGSNNDPSFVHYMTYENLGTHNFKSLFNLTKQAPIFNIPFEYTEFGDIAGYGNPYGIMTYSFPCDFDLLSDVLNGVNGSGVDINSAMTVNPLSRSFNLFGSKIVGCGIGSGTPKMSITNQGTEKQQDSCPDNSKLYLQKRQARMSLLEQDKIALRLTVPWNPSLHAGKVIEIKLKNRRNPLIDNYGTGKYLISSMKHHLKYGGFSTTTMDCVSVTVGQGIL